MSGKIALNNNCQSNPSKSEGCEHNPQVPTTLENIKKNPQIYMDAINDSMTIHFHPFPIHCKTLPQLPFGPDLGLLELWNGQLPIWLFWDPNPDTLDNGLMWLSYSMALHGYSFLRSSWTLVHVGAVPLFWRDTWNHSLLSIKNISGLATSAWMQFPTNQLRAENSPTFDKQWTCSSEIDPPSESQGYWYLQILY